MDWTQAERTIDPSSVAFGDTFTHKGRREFPAVPPGRLPDDGAA
jgi:hypothetical protein